MIDNELMWLEALGLGDDKVEKIQNLRYDREMARRAIGDSNGIWMPNSGTCEQVEQGRGCQLPFGSRFYSWSQRDKEHAKLLNFY